MCSCMRPLSIWWTWSYVPSRSLAAGVESAKFWLDPVALARNLGFRPKELGRIERVVTEQESECLEAWHEYFEQ